MDTVVETDIEIDMTEKINNIILDIQQSKLSSSQIWKKYNISKYRYYKLMDEYKLKNELFKQGPKGPSGPKSTEFKQLLYGTLEDQEKAKTLPEQFNLDQFLLDSKTMLIHEIRVKHKLTIYQVRELRATYMKDSGPEEMEKIPSTFDIERFKVDCKKKMTLDKLKSKYSLTLYQVRELRKIHDLKAKRKK
jgi:hypothetical protein